MMTPSETALHWRVLVIDDSRFDRVRLRLLLEDEAIDLFESDDGEHGAALARSERPDLILLDYMMPFGDGFGTIRLLKDDPRTASIPVIFLSAATDAGLKAQGLDLGAVDFLSKPFDPVELRARVRAALRMKNVQNQLERRAYIDGLTGLGNRLALDEWLRAGWGACQRRGAILSAMVADLDHFKKINDDHGHGVGDEVLRHFAQCLREGVRLTDFIGRYGGEEFVVMALDCPLSGALGVAERLRRALADQPLQFEGHRLRVTTSVGVATTGDPLPSGPMELIAAADKALYRAKQAGRNAVWFWAGTESRPLSDNDHAPMSPPEVNEPTLLDGDPVC